MSVVLENLRILFPEQVEMIDDMERDWATKTSVEERLDHLFDGLVIAAVTSIATVQSLEELAEAVQ